MRMPTATADEAKAFEFNRQSILNALRELQVDFHEGPKEAVMPCFVTAGCETGKRGLYLNIKDKPGVWHCFKCGETGFFSQFVAYYTNWGEFKLVSFLRRHRPTTFEVEGEAQVIKQYFTEADVTQGKYAYRHEYCYDRKLDETTLRRYRVGYDRDENDIIFPWYDRVGKLIAIKRRAVLTKYYRFECNESIEHLLYGLHLVRPRATVWITEGEFDAMFLDQTFRTYKLTHHGAVALGGKYLRKAAQEQLLLKAPSLIVLALDNDLDGDKAASVIDAQLAGIVPTYRMKMDGKDPNESSIENIIIETTNATNTLQSTLAKERSRYDSYLERKSV